MKTHILSICHSELLSQFCLSWHPQNLQKKPFGECTCTSNCGLLILTDPPTACRRVDVSADKVFDADSIRSRSARPKFIIRRLLLLFSEKPNTTWVKRPDFMSCWWQNPFCKKEQRIVGVVSSFRLRGRIPLVKRLLLRGLLKYSHFADDAHAAFSEHLHRAKRIFCPWSANNEGTTTV